MNYYLHHIGDYSKDTAHISMLEDAAYRRMLDVYYATEKPLPQDQQKIHRLVRAKTHQEKLAVDVILGEFFTESPEGWRNKRADEELSKTHAKSDAARTSAAKRWHTERNANAMRTQCEGNARPACDGNAPNNQYPINNTPIPPSGAFLQFWTAWPKHQRKQSQGKCWSLWRQKDFDQLAPAIHAHVEALKVSPDWQKDGGAYIPAPLVYLNQRRWEGAETADEQLRKVAM